MHFSGKSIDSTAMQQFNPITVRNPHLPAYSINKNTGTIQKNLQNRHFRALFPPMQLCRLYQHIALSSIANLI